MNSMQLQIVREKLKYSWYLRHAESALTHVETSKTESYIAVPFYPKIATSAPMTVVRV